MTLILFWAIRCGKARFFTYFNNLIDSGKKLLMSSHLSVNGLRPQLADLSSRLRACGTLRLEELDDNGLVLALISRAESRGMQLSENAANYIITHCPRDAQVLFQFLETLDRRSLQAQRKLTIPFIKEVLNEYAF